MSDFGRCPHCGLVHFVTCPRIKAIEYHDNGTMRRLEFHEPPTFPPMQNATETPTGRVSE